MKLEDGKDVYDKIKIPKELDQIICNTINKYPKENPALSQFNRKIRVFTITKYAVTAALVVFICITVALNTNEAFAKGVMKIPVIGQIARVLTAKSYQSSEGNTNITVNLPAVEIEENTEQLEQDQFVADINTEIERIVNDYLSDAESRLATDKEAFIATGGTEEEWAERDLNIFVDYEVKHEQGNLLSLVLVANESWYGAYDLKYYYNINLEENKTLTLEDVLGEDYKAIANDSIIHQMKEQMTQNTAYVYWGVTDTESGITGFTTVDENTKFYLNGEGKPVVCFAKYEVAPGFMGDQEFIIE